MDVDAGGLPGRLLAGGLPARLLAGALLAGLLAWRGLRKGSLDASGAAAAFCVGLVHMACGWQHGGVLIVFYLTGSALTKWGQAVKNKMEEGLKACGKRNAVQVLANSVGGAATALLCLWSRGAPGDGRPLAGGGLAAGPPPPWAAGAAAAAFVGWYACCCADTWASEAGVLSRRPPRLVTTWRPVPPGTNGGVSLGGTLWGVAGGAFVGASWAALCWLAGDPVWLAAAPGGRAGWRGAAAVVALSTAAGFAGCLADSLLGATVQYSGVRQGRVVGRPGRGVRHVAGRDWLSNDAVNLLAATATSVACGLGVAQAGRAGWL